MEEKESRQSKLEEKEQSRIDCLVFADDLGILAESIEDSIKQINILKETAGRAGLQVSFEKTEYTRNVKETQKYM